MQHAAINKISADVPKTAVGGGRGSVRLVFLSPQMCCLLDLQPDLGLLWGEPLSCSTSILSAEGLFWRSFIIWIPRENFEYLLLNPIFSRQSCRTTLRDIGLEKLWALRHHVDIAAIFLTRHKLLRGMETPKLMVVWKHDDRLKE